MQQTNRVISNRGALYNPANHPLSNGKPAKKFKRDKVRSEMESNRKMQAAHGVNVSIGITLHPKTKVQKDHHCFKCKTDKPVSNFLSAGFTWCIPCQQQ